MGVSSQTRSASAAAATNASVSGGTVLSTTRPSRSHWRSSPSVPLYATFWVTTTPPTGASAATALIAAMPLANDIARQPGPSSAPSASSSASQVGLPTRAYE